MNKKIEQPSTEKGPYRNYIPSNLYGKFNVQRVSVSRMINSKGTGRGKVKEILVTNYK